MIRCSWHGYVLKNYKCCDSFSAAIHPRTLMVVFMSFSLIIDTSMKSVFWVIVALVGNIVYYLSSCRRVLLNSVHDTPCVYMLIFWLCLLCHAVKFCSWTTLHCGWMVEVVHFLNIDIWPFPLYCWVSCFFTRSELFIPYMLFQAKRRSIIIPFKIGPIPVRMAGYCS